MLADPFPPLCQPSHVCRGICFALAAVLAITFPRFADGQQEYTLTDDDQWTATDAADPGTPEGQIQQIRTALAEEDYDRAESLATRWIKRHPRHELLPEAYLLRGDALYALHNYYESLFEYEFIARRFPSSEAFIPALEREYEIARMFVAGKKRKLWGLRWVDARADGEELLIRIQERLPGSRLAELAGMDLADFYFARRKMQLAAEAYELFIENYPGSDQLPKARRRLVYSFLAAFKGPQFDATGLYEARARLQQLKVIDPVTADEVGADALLTRISESDALKMLQTAIWYRSVDNYVSCEFTIRRLLRRYPDSIAATDALRMIPDILKQLPENVIDEAPDYDALRAAALGTDENR